jgi:hypothetical protein
VRNVTVPGRDDSKIDCFLICKITVPRVHFSSESHAESRNLKLGPAQASSLAASRSQLRLGVPAQASNSPLLAVSSSAPAVDSEQGTVFLLLFLLVLVVRGTA